MKTYQQFINEIKEPDEVIPLDEATLFAIAIERKLKSAVNKIHATNDTNKKIDLLATALHFSLGSLALQLNKSKRR